MPRTTDFIDLRLISKISSLYYHNNLSQLEIANRLNLSRPKVSRLLKEARERGIVKITVMYSDDNFVDLEAQIENRFNLKEAIIVNVDETSYYSNDRIIKNQLGNVGANYLHRTITNGDVIGVAWGTTLQALVEHLKPQQLDDLHVVQLLGGVGLPEAKAHAADLSRRIAQLFYARLTLLPAPGIVSNSESKKVFLADSLVQSAIDIFPKVTKAIVGIGALSTNSVLDNRVISSKIYKELTDKEAVGDLSLRFFNKNGEKVESSLENKLIGISLPELKKINNVIAIAGGSQKYEAISGALKSGYINVLITDILTAKRLVSE